VALIGRPNVGKSTFFNQVTRSREAIVDDSPGVTRDRHYAPASWNARSFILVDTGGLIGGDPDPFAPQVQEQVREAVAEADAVVVLLDGRAGLTPFDREVVALVRGLDKPVFYAVNKIDGPREEHRLADFYPLGVAPLYPLSAEHRYGAGELLDALLAALPQAETEAAPEPGPEAEAEPEAIRVAVVGRPNVGKSSLVNRLLGRERLLVSPIPGTTRDAIDSPLSHRDIPFVLIDTAGIRRRGKTSAKIEKFSVLKALRSLERCHVALVVLDAGEGVAEQDMTVAGYAQERGCGCVLVLNKWDVVAGGERPAVDPRAALRDAARFLPYAPVLSVSARTGLRVGRVLDQVKAVYDHYSRRIGTGALNQILESAVARSAPPMHRGRRIKFYYATQVSTRPPTVVLFTNYPEAVHFSYARYLNNRIREEAGLELSPLRLLFRQRSGKDRPRRTPAGAH
jgi:GTP-binding protein